MKNVEFFVSPDAIHYQPLDQSIRQFVETDREAVTGVLTIVRQFYPAAYARLAERYSKSQKNRAYFEFLMASRFIRCNCPAFDTSTLDIDANGVMHFEQVICPMRGECPDENVICRPALHCELSPAEMRVLACQAEGHSIAETAELLHLSPNTIKTHIANIKIRLHVDHMKQAIAWYFKRK